MTNKSPAPIDSAKVEDTGEPESNYMLSYELEGVVIDTEENGFDAVCLETVKRVRDALRNAAPRLPNTTPSTQAVGEPVAWRARGYAQFKTGSPGEWRYYHGASKPSLNNPDCCDIEPLGVIAAPPANAQTPMTPALRELENIVNAKRFDHDHFEDDTSFADWVQSGARACIALLANGATK